MLPLTARTTAHACLPDAPSVALQFVNGEEAAGAPSSSSAEGPQSPAVVEPAVARVQAAPAAPAQEAQRAAQLPDAHRSHEEARRPAEPQP